MVELLLIKQAKHLCENIMKKTIHKCIFKMNNKDIKTFHAAQDAQEIGVTVRNSSDTQTAPASGNVNQLPVNGQAAPQSSNVNQFPVYGQVAPQSSNEKQLQVYSQAEPQSSNVNRLPVNGQAAPQSSNVNQLPVCSQAEPQNSNVNRFPVNGQAAPSQSSNVKQFPVYSQAAPQSSNVNQHPVNGQTAPQSSNVHVNQLPVNGQAALWRSSVIELPINGQVALQGSNVNQLPVNIPSLGNNPTGFRANGDVVYSESRSQPQAYGVHYEASGTLATVKAEMQTSGTTTDTVQEESFVAQPFIENAAAYAPPQQYNHQDTHASVIVPPTNTPSVNELMYEARQIDEFLAKSDVVPQRLENVFCLTGAENTSDYGHENKATTIDAVARSAPQQRKKKATSRAARRRHNQLVRVPRPQPEILEREININTDSNNNERNGMQEEEMAEHDQNEDHMAEKGEDEGENTDPCPTCKKTFDNHNMQIHLHKRKKSSSHKQASFKCAYCKQQFNKEYVHDGHLITKHPDKNSVKEMLQQRISCVDCDKTFQSEALRRHHRIIVHIIKQRLFKCDILGCNKEPYKSESHFKNHMKEHKEEYKMTCEHCGKGFHDKVVYHIHIKRHYGEKEFNCDICNEKY